MDFLQRHLISLVILVGCVATIYLLSRIMVKRYASRVKADLGQFVRPTGNPVIVPLPIPPPDPSDWPTLAARKHQLWDAIHKHPLEQYTQVRSLVHNLAVAQLDAQFLDTYLLLWGSQHRFLQELNLNRGTTNREGAQKFLAMLAEGNAEIGKHALNNWLGFLETRGLVSAAVDSITLTPAGQDFLVWVLRRQLPTKTFEGA